MDGLLDFNTAIAEAGQGQVYIAIMHPQHGELLRCDGKKISRVDAGPIGGLAAGPDGSVWYTIDKRLRRLGAKADDAEEIAIDIQRWIFISHAGRGWVEGLGTFDARAGAKAAFEFDRRKDVPFPIAQDSYNNLWAIVSPDRERDDYQVVVLPDAGRGKAIPLGEAERLKPDRWSGVQADEFGFVWIVGDQLLSRFDPRKPAAGATAFPLKPELFGCVGRVRPNAMCVGPSGRMAVGLVDGGVVEVDIRAPEGPSVGARLLAGRPGTDDQPVRAMHVDAEGALWVVAGGKITRVAPPVDAWQRTWRALPRLPYSNHDIHGVVIDGKLYIATAKSYHGYPAKLAVLNPLWCFDPARETWAELPPVPTNRCYAGAAALAGELWVIGGHDDVGHARTVSDAVEIYEPKAKKWRTGPSIPAPLSELVAATVGDRIYIVGGVGDGVSASNKVASRGVMSIGAGEKAWRREPDAPGPVSQSSGCAVGGRLYIAAGARIGGSGLYVFDPEAKAWWLNTMPGPAPAAAIAMAFDGKVWLIGGWGGDEPRGTAIYDPATRTWSRGPLLPTPLSWGAAGSIGGHLLVVGGAYHSPPHGDYIFSDRAFVLRKP
ncbi:MAG: hypothetical protein NTW19_11220 [Planctomycetota bacterium]|nr:hypothetical protein [Planctomycetota bacterium]